MLQEKQQCRIHELERELLALRSQHTETIQQLKKAFLQEKHDSQANADKRISEMSKQANQVSLNLLLNDSLLFEPVTDALRTLGLGQRGREGSNKSMNCSNQKVNDDNARIDECGTAYRGPTDRRNIFSPYKSVVSS